MEGGAVVFGAWFWPGRAGRAGLGVNGRICVARRAVLVGVRRRSAKKVTKGPRVARLEVWMGGGPSVWGVSLVGSPSARGLGGGGPVVRGAAGVISQNAATLCEKGDAKHAHMQMATGGSTWSDKDRPEIAWEIMNSRRNAEAADEADETADGADEAVDEAADEAADEAEMRQQMGQMRQQTRQVRQMRQQMRQMRQQTRQR